MDLNDSDRTDPPPVVPRPDEVHDRYALALRIGVPLVMVLLAAAFVVYAFGLLPPAVPLSDLPQYWSLPADRFVAETGLPTGAQWTGRLGQGDVLTIIPAVFLVSLTALCLVSVLPIFARRRDRVFVVIVVLQLIVLVIAAWPSGT